METSIALQNFTVKTGTGSNSGIVENPILNAARNGNAAEIRRLLQLKNVETNRPLYPRDWKYTFQNLCEKDSDGSTALHLAAAVGDPEMSLDCVNALLESVQLLVNEKEWPNFVQKYVHFVNLTDRNGETALHLAIENRASDVVVNLLNRQGNMVAKNRDGVEALRLIYEHFPEALTQLYDDSIQLTPDCKGLEIKWGAIIGYNQSTLGTRESSGSNSGQAGGKPVPDPGLWIESRNLKYVLNSDKWGARILTHPLIELYLERKWEKIQWFFWAAFTLEMIWLLLYAAAFVALHVERGSQENSTVNSTHPNGNGSYETSSGSSGYLALWLIMALFTVLCALKDVCQLFMLRKAYFNFENVLRDVFIVLVIAQVALLIMGQPEIVITTSAIGLILGTMLIIFQLGKTPCFGLQVAAWKKVMFTFVPHVPVFFTWLIGFGLIFWTILYKAQKSWFFGMVAIMAAMGAGELNAHEHLKNEKDAEITILREGVRAFAVLSFVIIFLIFYFNLLIAYAVTDIQILTQKAKALQLSNKLSTIYTVESFLLSGLGRVIIRLKGYLGSRLPFLFQNKSGSSVDSIYIIPPRDFNSCQGKGILEFIAIPPKLRKMLSKIAYANKEKKVKEPQRIQEMVLELLGIRSAGISSDGRSN